METKDRHSRADTVRFHARRLYEMATYEACLEELVFPDNSDLDKEALSDRRLLRQPISYQVLTLIWISGGSSSAPSGSNVLTVYSISNQISRSRSVTELNKTINYVTRVTHAANRAGLVTIGELDERSRHPIEANHLLDLLMDRFAKTCAAFEIETGESDASR